MAGGLGRWPGPRIKLHLTLVALGAAPKRVTAALLVSIRAAIVSGNEQAAGKRCEAVGTRRATSYTDPVAVATVLTLEIRWFRGRYRHLQLSARGPPCTLHRPWLNRLVVISLPSAGAFYVPGLTRNRSKDIACDYSLKATSPKACSQSATSSI